MSNPRFEEIDDDDPAEMDLAEFAGPSSVILPAHDLPQPASGGMPTSADAAFKPHMITQQDLEEFKNWSCVYPIYFDASRSYKEGRRVPLKYAVENPMAQQLAEATTSLNIQSIFEVIQRFMQVVDCS
jgi:signal recognition particle subunit SRP19